MCKDAGPVASISFLLRVEGVFFLLLGHLCLWKTNLDMESVFSGDRFLPVNTMKCTLMCVREKK